MRYPLPPHWPQPPAVRLGLGAGLTDFAAQVAADPQFASAWGDIEAQLNVEGADASAIDLAKTALINSYQQLASQVGVGADEVIASAKSYVMMGQTVLGAVNTVSGLVQAAESGSFPQITQTFTGTLIGLATLAGAVSAGVGAAIVGAVSGLLGILQSSGFFGQPSTDVNIQGCGFFDMKPEYLVGCVGVWTQGIPIQVAPGSSSWRSFPNPASTAPTVGTGTYAGYSDQQIWFTSSGPAVGGGLWRGCLWHIPGTIDHPGNRNQRTVDVAFPNYHLVEGYASGSPFEQAFFGAWKSNAEYALNGLKTQTDALVLIHLLRMWNRAHNGPATVIDQSSGGYLATLISAAVAQLSAGDALRSGSGLLVNAGAVKTPGATKVGLHIAHGAVTALAPTASTTSTATIVAGTAAVGGAALIGTAIYAAAKGQAIDAVVGHLWRKLKSAF